MGMEGIRQLILPNCKVVDEHLLKPAMSEADERKKFDAEMVVAALLRALETLERAETGIDQGMNGHVEGEALKQKLQMVVGEVLGEKLYELGQQRPKLVEAVLENGKGLGSEQ